jgi:hypothetical protein
MRCLQRILNNAVLPPAIKPLSGSKIPRGLKHRATSLLAFAVVPAAVAVAAAVEPLAIGSTRQLFVDDFLIEARRNVELELHQPVPREVVLTVDRPWENRSLTYVSVLRDGDRFLMYYRGASADAKYAQSAPANLPTNNWTYTALAESADGIKWTKPTLNLVEFNGSTANNLVWPTDANKPWRDKNYPGTDIFPFKDENPAAPAAQRFKALANLGEFELVALVSPDGRRWSPLRTEPVISFLKPNAMMDPPTVSYWDPISKRYVAYARNWINYRIRGFRRLTSEDFLKWSEPEPVVYGESEVEQLYTSMAVPYERAPNLTLFFSKRFARTDRLDPRMPGLSEIVFLSSRDGITFERRFMEPFLPPGLEPKNWGPRGIMMGRGILQTSPTEMSLYYNEHYGHETARVRRATIRTDGFVSVHAPWEGGEFTTKPFVFEGTELELNYSTSVAGSIRVEVLEADGKPIPGFRAEDCYEIFGDEIQRTVSWRKGHDEIAAADRTLVPYSPTNVGLVAAGRPVRLRFVMKAAHLYSFRFR